MEVGSILAKGFFRVIEVGFVLVSRVSEKPWTHHGFLSKLSTMGDIDAKVAGLYY